MKQKGYVLIEVLLASILLSMVGLALCTGVVQGLRAERVIRKTWKAYDPLRSFWMRMEHDLRNGIVLRDYPFRGKRDELSFPVLSIQEDNAGAKIYRLSRVRYFIKDGNLLRGEQELSTSLVKAKPQERIILKGVTQVRFLYSYLDDEEKIKFESFWLEKPYYGLPRAVKIEAKTPESGVLMEKLIALPQGKWGHFQTDSPKEMAYAA